jgi:hypothetical protein
VTAPQTEGPFFKPKSPLRAFAARKGFVGERMVLAGVVLSRACKPVANALLDFWHSDDMGEYDNAGFRYRGHQFSDAGGALSPRDDRAAALSRPHAPFPREGAGAAEARADDADLLPGEPATRATRSTAPPWRCARPRARGASTS